MQSTVRHPSFWWYLRVMVVFILPTIKAFSDRKKKEKKRHRKNKSVKQRVVSGVYVLDAIPWSTMFEMGTCLSENKPNCQTNHKTAVASSVNDQNENIAAKLASDEVRSRSRSRARTDGKSARERYFWFVRR